MIQNVIVSKDIGLVQDTWSRKKVKFNIFRLNTALVTNPKSEKSNLVIRWIHVFCGDETITLLFEKDNFEEYFSQVCSVLR